MPVKNEFKEQTAPHVIVKLLPGRSEKQKVDLARQIVKDVMRIANADEESVSTAIEEVAAEDSGI